MKGRHLIKTMPDGRTALFFGYDDTKSKRYCVFEYTPEGGMQYRIAYGSMKGAIDYIYERAPLEYAK